MDKRVMTIRTRISHCSAPSARFERARYGLEGRCSIQLSYEGNSRAGYCPESLRLRRSNEEMTAICRI